MRATTIQANGIVPALTSIRFLAALTVVLSHYRELELLNTPESFFNFVDGGRSAVSLFFVLSGFILTYTYRDELATQSPHNFYVARVARIYPNILFALAIASITTAYLVISHNEVLMLKWFALKSAVNLSLVVSFVAQVLLITAWFPFAAINQPWNGPASSVSCEAFFYALFPLILARFVKMRAKTLVITLIGVWIAQGLMIEFFMVALPISRSHFLAGTLPICRIAEFMLGIGAALAFQGLRARGVSMHKRGMALVAGSVVALIILALWQPTTPVFYPQSPFFATLILGLALLERPVFGVLNQRWLVRFGEASYALFLIHVPIAYLAWLAGFRANNGWIPLVFTLLFSVVVFTYFEEPMRRRIRSRFRSKALAPASVAAGTGAVDPSVSVGPGMTPG
ncbi:acyltransferase [Paraburkholderia sp. C35]|uniref:acyltransferase family protein n=1 Tax=Paraburkholderia sp. C35 TaxID=2126993 RepID=UPI000D68B7A3|nr:acyltransferase [Paraburkholderia sp. C35]